MSLKIFQEQSSSLSTPPSLVVEEFALTTVEKPSAELLNQQVVLAQFTSHLDSHQFVPLCIASPSSNHSTQLNSMPQPTLHAFQLECLPQYSRDQRLIQKRLSQITRSKKSLGQYQLLVIPDMGSPVLEATSSAVELATRLQKHVTAASEAYALNDYHFFAFAGECVELLIDEDLNQAAVKVGGELFKARVYAPSATALVGGRLPTANVVDSTVKANPWDSDDFDLG